MTIPDMTPIPQRNAPATFSAYMDALLAKLPSWGAAVDAIAAAFTLNATSATSTTSLAIATGSKSLTVDLAKSYLPGMSVKIARTSSPSNWMHGDVTSYNTGTGALVVNVTTILGSGTYTDWTITLSAPAGAAAGLVAVTHASSPYTVLASNLTGLVIHTNTGATAEVVYQLPAGAAGLTFRGRITAAYNFKIKAAAGEKIRCLDLLSNANGYMECALVGALGDLEWNGSEWDVVNIGRPWTYGSY